jgi:hypothetical protein
MQRVETFCGGHLLKVFDQVNVGPTADKPYNQYIDGRYCWMVDGVEISEESAQAMIRGWPLEPGGPCRAYGGAMPDGRVRLCGLDRWHVDSHAYEFEEAVRDSD